MNVQLLNPHEADYPDLVEEELQEGGLQARCCAFNRRGTLLATGCQDGCTLIWDFETRGVVKVLQHKEDGDGSKTTVVALGWSMNGRRLITSEDKGRVRVWDVESGTMLHVERYGSQSLTVQISPIDPNTFVACPNQGVPALVNIESKTSRKIEGAHTPDPAAGSNRSKNPAEANRNYTACFEPEGKQLYVGSGKGFVSIWNVETLEQEGNIQLPSSTPARNMQFTRDGNFFLVSETGKIRVYDSREGTLYREFLDQVNRTQWRKCLFSADGQYVVGATAEKGEHSIHIWSKDNGQLIHQLQGPKESILDLAWHPARPIIASLSHTGKVLVWAKQYAENYSAFAPNFKELEENEEYIEREDEFDLIDQQEVVKKKQEEEEAVEVDITTLDDIPSQFEDLEGELVYLPAIPDKDIQLVDEEKNREVLDPTPDIEIKTRVFDLKDGRQVQVLHAKRVSATSEAQNLGDPKKQKTA